MTLVRLDYSGLTECYSMTWPSAKRHTTNNFTSQGWTTKSFKRTHHCPSL